MLSVTITGALNLAVATARIAAVRATALQAGAEVLRSISVPMAPLETGALRASCQATSDDQRGCVSYNTIYAVLQHEKTWYRHRDGQAKYLSGAFAPASGQIAAVVSAQIRRALA